MVPLKYSNDTAPYKKLNFFPPFLVLGVGHPSVTCSWHVLWRTGQQFYRDAGGKKKKAWKMQLFSLASVAELLYYFERRTHCSCATGLKHCGPHQQTTLSWNTTCFHAYFLFWNKQETFLWNRQHNLILYQNILILLKSKSRHGWKKMFWQLCGACSLRGLTGPTKWWQRRPQSS